MDIKGISGNAAAPQNAAVPSAGPGAGTAPAASQPEAAQPKHDTVELTGPALAKSLKLAGQTPAQIALKMGLDIKTIDNYLNVKEAKAAPANPAPQAQQVTANAAAAPRQYSPLEEATESAAQKTAETAQGKK